MCLESSNYKDLSTISVHGGLTESTLFGIPSHPLVVFGVLKPFLKYPMCAQVTRLSDLKVKAAKPQEKDYVLSDGDGLQIRVRRMDLSFGT
ncbi:hypothetical protein GCM10009504_13940 [Pseudomonas laurentiana]|nr:hypothetical protein GCM10009504_13940 [Pseudomonas laurentiana]